jgi:cytochrome d ubiquinol oxidase subunit II
LQADGYFFEPLWTNWRVGSQPGVLDWYTVIGGLTALVALAVHGAAYVALKTSGPVNARARRLAIGLWPLLLVLTIVSLAATIDVRPGVLDNFLARRLTLIIPLAVFLALAAFPPLIRRGREREAFVASAVFLAAMMAGAAAGLYPTLLPSSSNPAESITIFNAAAGRQAMAAGLTWWTGGMVLALAYFVFVYRMFRGKVPA